jgi:hypothetical protein
MARVEIRVSDLSREPIREETQAVRLIVEHPLYPEPVGLDVLAEEVAPHLTEESSQFVVVSLEEPDNPTPQRYVMALETFNSLFVRADAETALADAYSQQQEAQRNRRRGGRRTGGRRQQAEPRQRERVDYATPEHAGEPHRGTVSDAEKDYVRQHLEEVNARLREKGMREINPNDSDMAARYRLDPPIARDDAEAEREVPQR